MTTSARSPEYQAALEAARQRQAEREQRDEDRKGAASLMSTLKPTTYFQDEPEEPDENTRGLLGDISLSALSGAARAVNETRDTLAAVDTYVASISPELQAVMRGTPLVGPLFGGAALSQDAEIALPTTESQTTAGAVVQGVSQFLVGFVGASKVTAPLNFGKGLAGNFTRASVNGMIADATVFDPHEERLSNLINEFPALRNPVTEYLAAEEDDGELEGRLKGALEGLLVGAVLEPFIMALRGLKNSKAAKAALEKIRTKMEGPPEVTPVRNVPTEIKAPTEVDPVKTPGPRREIDATPDAAKVTALKVPADQRAAFEARLKAGDIEGASELVDFNHNYIDFDAVSDADSLRGVLNAVSEDFSGLVKKAKGGKDGVQSLATTESLARLLGKSSKVVDDLFRDVRGGKGLSARMLAARNTVLASGERLLQLARAVETDGGNETLLAFRRHLDIHAAIQAEYSGSKTELARALRSMQIVAKATPQDVGQLAKDSELQNLIRTGRFGGDLRKIASKVVNAGSHEAANAIVRKTAWQHVRDAYLEIYINGLLSSPKTLALNVLSNTAKLFESIPERYLASTIGRLRTLRAGADQNRIRFREGNAMMYGAIEGFMDAFRIPLKEIAQVAGRGIKHGPKEAAQLIKDLRAANQLEFGNFYKALRTGEPVLDSRQKIEVHERTAIATTAEDVERLLGMKNGRWIAAAYNFLGVKNGRWIAGAYNFLGEVIRLPGRGIIATDEVFKNIAYRQELRARAYRRSAESADGLGLQGLARRDEVAKSVKSELSAPPEDVSMGAMDFARYQTFQEELGAATKWVEHQTQKHPALRLLFPFIRTPANILKQTLLERSPLSLVSKRFWNTVRAGGPDADIAIARMAAGTTLWTMGYYFASQGLITGAGPLRPRGSRNSEQLDNIPPYSLRLPGTETWVQFNRLEPLGMLLGTAADVFEIMNHEFDPDDDFAEVAFQAAAASITAVYMNVISKVYLQSISDIFSLLSSPDQNLRWLTSRYAATFTAPAFISMRRTLAQEEDPVSREAFSYIEALKKDIPGLSDELPARRDILGDEIPVTPGLGPQWLSPIRMGEEPKDPVRKKLVELQFNFQMPAKAIDGQRLTAAQYSRMLEIAKEQGLYESLKATIESPGFDQLPAGSDLDVGQVSAIKAQISQHMTSARQTLLLEDPELHRKVLTRRLRAQAVPEADIEALLSRIQ